VAPLWEDCCALEIATDKTTEFARLGDGKNFMQVHVRFGMKMPMTLQS